MASITLLSAHLEIVLDTEKEHWDDILISVDDAASKGITRNSYGIFCVPSYLPNVFDRRAVRIIIDLNRIVPPGKLLVGSLLYDMIQYGLRAEWRIDIIESHQMITSLTLEFMTEHPHLRREFPAIKRSQFTGRCFLVEPMQIVSDLSLPIYGAYYNVHDISPPLQTVRSTTVFEIDDETKTEVNVFVPYSKGGVDIVVVIDASWSMDLYDYADQNNRANSRINVATQALRALLKERLNTAGRTARFALITFGKQPHVAYPVDGTMVELLPERVRDLQRKINVVFLTQGIDRQYSNVAAAINKAADLLSKNARDDNEKIIVLLSDGADWSQNQDEREDQLEGNEERQGRFEAKGKSGRDDLEMLVGDIYEQSKIRIHTIAISNAENVRTFYREVYELDTQRKPCVYIPNPQLLQSIARRTNGIFFPSPDIETLKKLFEELGKGVRLPVT